MGFRWLRGNDNDSIGEDDRRGALAGGQTSNKKHAFSRAPRRPRPSQRQAAGAAEHLLHAPGGTATMKCLRADVVTHLGNSRKQQLHPQSLRNEPI